METVNTHLEHGVKCNVPKLIVIHAMGEYIGGTAMAAEVKQLRVEAREKVVHL